MIGDRYDTDIMGAKSLGIDGILISKDQKDCKTIKSLIELKDIL
jgi:FMN phosphatase YigB (HAD superfamily)